MKKNKLYLTIGICMIILMILFVGFALQHPEMSFPFNNMITYTLYFLYITVIILMFVLYNKRK